MCVLWAVLVHPQRSMSPEVPGPTEWEIPSPLLSTDLEWARRGPFYNDHIHFRGRATDFIFHFWFQFQYHLSLEYSKNGSLKVWPVRGTTDHLPRGLHGPASCRRRLPVGAPGSGGRFPVRVKAQARVLAEGAGLAGWRVLELSWCTEGHHVYWL